MNSESTPSTPLEAAIVTERAEAILGTLERLRREVDLAEAFEQTVEQFVENEPHPELKRLGEVLVLARRQALLQHYLDDDREQLHHGHLEHEARESVGHHYEMLRRQACEYNHLLRGLIESASQYFSREELLAWLRRSSQGRRGWAESEVKGAVSEIALHAAMQGLPELRALRYGTLAEDLAGFDFVAEYQGELITFDAKTGYYRALVERKHGHRHIEISVPRQVIEELRITRHGLDVVRRDVRQALAQAV